MGWHNQLRNQTTVEDTRIIHAGGVLNVLGTKVDPESLVNAQGVRVQSEYFLFMFNTKDVEKVRFQRGVILIHLQHKYEVVYQPSLTNEFDDPSGLTTNVWAKRCD